MKKFAFGSLATAVAILLAACSAAGGSEPESITLSTGDGGAMMSCLPLDPATLAEFPMAFEGKATKVDGDSVTLDVEQWFKGGDADEVILNAPQGMEALIAGIDFEVGKTYLISATDGQVNYCGFSGEATEELRAAFDAAFGS